MEKAQLPGEPLAPDTPLLHLAGRTRLREEEASQGASPEL